MPPRLHHVPPSDRLHLPSVRFAPVARASDALPCRMSQSSNPPSRSALRSPRFPRASSLLRPRLTSRAASRRRPFRRKARSPQVRYAPLHRTTAGSTPPRLGHESFAVIGPLALLGSALYPVPAIRPIPGAHPSGASLRLFKIAPGDFVVGSRFTLHASSPRSVTLPQLRFTSLAVISSWRDFHPQGCAHAGRTNKKRALHQIRWVTFTGRYPPGIDRVHQGGSRWHWQSAPCCGNHGSGL